MEQIIPDVSVIIPVYKNRDTVARLHSLLTETLSNMFSEYEIVFVDDKCPQKSIDVLKEIAKQDKKVMVLGLAQNIGQQNAVLAGLKHSHGKTAIIMDADLQDPPMALPGLIAKLNDGYDVVFAGRRGSYQALHRLITSRFYKWALHIITGVPADAGLFMVLRRDVVDNVLPLRNDNPHLVAMLGLLNLKTASIPVDRDKRFTGESAYTSWMRLKVGFGATLWALKWKMGIREKTRDSLDEFPLQIMIRNRYTSQEFENVH